MRLTHIPDITRLDDIAILDLSDGMPDDVDTLIEVGHRLVDLLRTDGLIGINGHAGCQVSPQLPSMVHRLFGLDLSPYRGIGQAALRGFSQGFRDQMMWHVGPELLPEHPLSGRLPVNRWPTELPQFRDAVLSLYGQLEMIARDLMSFLAWGLDADEPHWRDAMRDHSSVLRFIHFPAQGEFIDGEIRLDEHVDGGMFAILPPAHGGGLEILRNGNWLRVPSRPGVVHIYAGSMTERLSNGYIPAVKHRVVARGFDDITRLSFPFFMIPHPDFLLTPVVTADSRDLKPRYSACTVEQALVEYMREYLAVQHDSGWARDVIARGTSA